MDGADVDSSVSTAVDNYRSRFADQGIALHGERVFDRDVTDGQDYPVFTGRAVRDRLRRA